MEWKKLYVLGAVLVCTSLMLATTTPPQNDDRATAAAAASAANALQPRNAAGTGDQAMTARAAAEVGKATTLRPPAQERSVDPNPPFATRSVGAPGAQNTSRELSTSGHQQPRAPSNDNCADAVTFNLTNGVPFAYSDDNTGATEDCAALSGGVYGEPWFKFTTTEMMDVSIRYCGTTPAFTNGYIVLDTACPCTGTFTFASAYENTSCGDGNYSLYWYNLPAGTYYWPLLTTSGAQGPYTVTFLGVVPMGACCLDDGSCGSMTELECNSSGGAYKGIGSTCAPGVCCPLMGDINADCSINGLEGQGFLVCLLEGGGAGLNCACGDFDYNGIISVADIESLVSYLLTYEVSITLVPPPEGLTLDAGVTPSVQLVAQVNMPCATRVQFEFSRRNGADWWATIAVDVTPGDGFTADWNFVSIPPGSVEVMATAFSASGAAISNALNFTLTNTRAAPQFISPAPDQQVSGDLLRLVVSQEIGTSGWTSVSFAYGTDGVNFQIIGVDDNGSDGFSLDWLIADLPPGGYVLRATVLDFYSRETTTITQISRVYESDLFDRVPTGPIMLTDYIGPGGTVPLSLGGPNVVPELDGRITADINTDAFEATPASRLRATLHLGDQTDTQVFSSDVEVVPGTTAGFVVKGLDAGTYRAVVVVTYSDGPQSYNLRSPVYDLTVLNDAPTNPLMPGFATELLDDLTSALSSATDASASVFMTHADSPAQAIAAVRSESGLDVDLVFAGYTRLNATTFMQIEVRNLLFEDVTDTVNFVPYSWDLDGDPVMGVPQSLPISLDSLEQTTIQFLVSEQWGAADHFAAFDASLASYSGHLMAYGFGVDSSTLALFRLIPFDLGFPGIKIVPRPPPQGYFQTGFPEYHWVQGEKVTNVLPPGVDPNAKCTWTIVNADGSTWSKEGRSVVKHAGILGGPHHVRCVCVSPNGTVTSTTTYGSETYVHTGITKTEVIPDATSPTLEFKQGRILVCGGPGGKLTYTQGLNVTVKVEISTTVSGTVGKEGVASIGTTIGVAAGVEITKSESASYEHEIPADKCAQLWEGQWFKVHRGVIKTTFADGTTITGRYEARVLDCVGFKYVEVPCPP